LKIEHN